MKTATGLSSLRAQREQRSKRAQRAQRAKRARRATPSVPAQRTGRAALSPYVMEDVAFTREEIRRAREAA